MATDPDRVAAGPLPLLDEVLPPDVWPPLVPPCLWPLVEVPDCGLAGTGCTRFPPPGFETPEVCATTSGAKLHRSVHSTVFFMIALLKDCR